MKNLINGKANAATTLAGYGITDGMTTTEIASAISTAIAGTDHLSRVMVDSTADIDVAADGAEKKIYMVKNTDGEAGNLYSEYMVIDGKLEKVGDWKAAKCRSEYMSSNLLRVVQEQQETIEKQSRLIADLIATLESWEQTAGYDGVELKERAKDLQLRERQDL